MGAKFYYNAKHKREFANGAVGYGSGGPFDCLGPYAKVENCPIDGTELRRTCYATGYADTMFSVPACTRYRGRYVSGFFMLRDDCITFVPNNRHVDRLRDAPGSKYRRYRFAVTFERVTEESAEQGDAKSRGYVLHNATLRDAIEEMRGSGGIEADCSHVSLANPPRWFTAYRTNDGTRDYYETGVEESRSLHLPRNITPSSAVRVARLLGVRVSE